MPDLSTSESKKSPFISTPSIGYEGHEVPLFRQTDAIRAAFGEGKEIGNARNRWRLPSYGEGPLGPAQVINKPYVGVHHIERRIRADHESI